MRLKVYHAANMGAAMAMVRSELGPDALILGTRTAQDGIEVTAALEPHAPRPLLPNAARLAMLRWHGVPDAIAETLAWNGLLPSLEARFAFGPLSLQPGAAPLLFVGPPGGGKTLTVARLATRLVLAGERPLVVSADGRRAGAADQLAAFTRLLGITLIVADEPLTLARALTRRQGGCPVLIDMPGLDHAASADRSFVQELVAACSGQPVLVLPTGLDPSEAGEIAEDIRAIGVRSLVATRLDQSRRLGGILAAAAAGLSLAEAGIGPSAAEGLCPFTADLLAERLEAGPPRPRLAQPAPPSPAPPPSRPLPPYIRPRDGQERRAS